MKSHPLLPTTNVKAQQPNPTQPNGPEPPRYKCFTYNPLSKQKISRNETEQKPNATVSTCKYAIHPSYPPMDRSRDRTQTPSAGKALSIELSNSREL